MRIVACVVLGLAAVVMSAGQAEGDPYVSPDGRVDVELAPAWFSAVSDKWYLLDHDAGGNLQPRLLVKSEHGYAGHYPTHLEDGDHDGDKDDVEWLDKDALRAYPVGSFLAYVPDDHGWIEYSARLEPAGVWRIGLDVRNFVWNPAYGAPWGYEFEIDYLDGEEDEDSFEGRLRIAGDDHESRYAYFELELATAAVVSVEFRWLNDFYSPSGKKDANLRIDRVFFDCIAPAGAVPVPEPPTAFLLGSGVVALAVMWRGAGRRRTA